MKADKEYSSIDVCPKTGDQMDHSDLYDTDGVCPYCGHLGYAVTHHDQIVGRFIRPNIWERIIEGKKLEFLRKDEEDKVWEGLQQ